jgi:hypothetical protein
MPANWDFYQNINFGTSRVEWPMGPMALTPGFAPRWVEAWVVQSSTGVVTSGAGASQSTSQRSGWSPGSTRWTADGIPPGWVNGSFQPGPALGIALLASRDSTGADEFDFWLDVVCLY